MRVSDRILEIQEKLDRLDERENFQLEMIAADRVKLLEELNELKGKRKIDTSKTRSGVQPFMDSFFKKRNKEK